MERGSRAGLISRAGGYLALFARVGITHVTDERIIGAGEENPMKPCERQPKNPYPRRIPQKFLIP